MKIIKRYSRFFILAGIFLATSGLIYYVHYRIFRDPYHIFIYMIGDFAFLPLEVFLVVVVIERILTYREKQNLLHKLNMVIGAFFSEVGSRLLGTLLNCFENRKEISQCLAIAQSWTSSDFKRAIAFASEVQVRVDWHNIDLDGLKTFLIEKRLFLLTLLENPTLLEHERFTDLLWAVLHLAEELEARPSVRNLPESDLQHITEDIQRGYGHLAAEWIRYVEHLKSRYPFLFSLVLRTHPFQEHPSPVVT